MRKPYVTEVPAVAGMVTGSSVGPGQIVPFAPNPPQPAARSAAISGSAKPSRTRVPLITSPSQNYRAKIRKKPARLPRRRAIYLPRVDSRRRGRGGGRREGFRDAEVSVHAPSARRRALRYPAHLRDGH